jgi:hypothetical protein
MKTFRLVILATMLAAIIIGCQSCSSFSLEEPGKFKLKDNALGRKLDIGEASVKVTSTNKDGTVTVQEWKLKGMKSDTVQAFEAGLEAGERGAKKAAGIP